MPFDFSEDKPFFDVYSVNYTHPIHNKTLSPSRTSRRSDYANAKKIDNRFLSDMTEEELAIINAVKLEDYPALKKNPAFQRLTGLYQSGWLGKKFPLEMHQKWFIYFHHQYLS